MELTDIKIVSAIAIFVIGLGGGLAARRLALGENGGRLLIAGNVFAGGVFLGAALIHVLPDAQEGFSQAYGDLGYPIYGLVCGLALGLMLALEQVGHALNRGADAARAYPLVLFLILSIHSVIAGFALGIETMHLQAIVLLVAVLAHKGSASFALGLSMLGDGPGGKVAGPGYFRQIVFFSLMTPIGIGLGWGASMLVSGTGAVKFEAIFDALAAGTFLYVAVYEILRREFSSREMLPLKVLSLGVGYGIMALIALWV